MSEVNLEARLQALELQGLEEPRLLPSEFMRIGAGAVRAVESVYSDMMITDATEEDCARAGALAGSIFQTLDSALTQVELDAEGQERASTAVRMLQASYGSRLTEHTHQLPIAEKAAAIFHELKAQLEQQPQSPILSIFVDRHYVNHHKGVTVQSAYAIGEVAWRSDPFP